MKAFSIVLLAALLMLSGCGEKAAGDKIKTATAAAGTLVPEDNIRDEDLPPEKKFARFQKKAIAGNAEAQFVIGMMYERGEGIPKVKNEFGDTITSSPKDAVDWYQKAAMQGHAAAQYNLGWMYYKGEGVPKDAAKAVHWYQQAAAQGLAAAQSILGLMYDIGEGVPKDAAKAVEWFQKAAAQGDAEAQHNLGVTYYKGKGVPKDATKAVEWFQKAAAQGHAQAQHNLGVMYYKGEGVPKDAAKAVEWYQQAAAQGHAQAQNKLGWMYGLGMGISKNNVRAYAWANLAAAQGDKDAKKIRDWLEKKLTATERTEGQRLASNWKKGDALIASSSSSSGTATPNDKPSKQSTGTAFAVSREGHALTNHHVINGCTEVKIAGRDGTAKVITSDSVNDLALLQLPGKTKDIASLNPDLGKLRQGEDIIVFGYPLEWALSSGGNLTPGTISALTGLGNNTNQIQMTAPIQPGSSGSPVMDKKGNVVGMVSMKLSDSKMAKATGSVGQNVNFAVNGQTVKAFLVANKVPYKIGGGFFSREKSNADIAEEARKWTVLVECWK